MATPQTCAPFEERWHDARYHDDLTATIELVIEAYETGDPPPWLEEEHRRLWGQVASRLDADLDDDATDLGRLAVRLSSARQDDYPLALLGLASMGVQRAEQDRPVEPWIPDLLHTMLDRYDAEPEHAHSEYVRRWRELAVQRIATLVRHDQERRVAAVRDPFRRAARAVAYAGVGAARPGDLAVLRDGLSVLAEAHHRLSRFVPILSVTDGQTDEQAGGQTDEQHVLFDDLGAYEELMAAGRNALRTSSTA